MNVYSTIYSAIYYRYAFVYVAIHIIMLYIQIKVWYLSKSSVYGCYCLATILKGLEIHLMLCTKTPF